MVFQSAEPGFDKGVIITDLGAGIAKANGEGCEKSLQRNSLHRSAIISVDKIWFLFKAGNGSVKKITSQFRAFILMNCLAHNLSGKDIDNYVNEFPPLILRPGPVIVSDIVSVILQQSFSP